MKQKNPFLVSIILPYFNGKKFIRETLKSICNQTYKFFEIIIIDDGSSRKEDSRFLKKIIKKQNDKRIKFFETENKGIAQARNFGLRNCSGEWISFIDQDDIWRNDKLAIQVNVIYKHQSAKFICSNASLYDTINKTSKNLLKAQTLKSGFIKNSYLKMLFKNFVVCSSVMFKKDLLKRCGLCNPYYRSCPDYEFFLRIAKETNIFYVNQPLVQYTSHLHNVSSNRWRMNLEVINALFSTRKDNVSEKILSSINFIKCIYVVLRQWITIV